MCVYSVYSKEIDREMECIERESNFSHISKQTPNPLTSTEYKDVVCFYKSKHSESHEMGYAN